MMRHRRRRKTLSPKQERLYVMMEQQQTISSILLSGVVKQLENNWGSLTQLDTCIEQLQEARIHLKEADRLDPYKRKPRKVIKK